MKTQKERLEELLKEFQIRYINNEHKDARGNWSDNCVVIHEGYKNNVGGYLDFYCQFEFDEQGKFMSVGVWE